MKVLWITPYNIGPYHHVMFSEAIKRIPNFSVLRVVVKENSRPWSSDVTERAYPTYTVSKEDAITNFLNNHNPDILFPYCQTIRITSRGKL